MPVLEKERAMDPATPPRELALWVPLCPEGVRENPYLPLLSVEDPVIYQAILARLEIVTYFQKRTARLQAWEGVLPLTAGCGWRPRENGQMVPPHYGLDWSFTLGCDVCLVLAPSSFLYQMFPLPDKVEETTVFSLWSAHQCDHFLRFIREVPP